MAQIEILVDREDGSRFALNYNKQTTGNLFRYARVERLFGKEEELRWRRESEYEGFFENSMAETEGEGGERRGKRGSQRRRINCDFFVDSTNSINLKLSSGFSTFTTEQAIKDRLHNVDDNRVWKLEEGTPIPEEFQVKSDDKGHVQILPNESVTTNKFKEMLCSLNWIKAHGAREPRNSRREQSRSR